MKLVHEGKRVKIFRVTGNLNNHNTRMIMDNITSHIEMRVKVIYSFKSVIYWGNSEVKDYSTTLDSAPGMHASLKEIQEYVEVLCEQIRLDLDNEEYGQKLFYPPQEQARYKVIMKARSFLGMFNKIGGIKWAISGLCSITWLVKGQALYLCTGHLSW